MATDQHYRRGIVLGLTFAEVFILLVFLLLLLLLPYADENEKVRQVLSVWEDPANIPTPEEVETLHDKSSSLDRMQAEKEDLIRNNQSLLRKVNDLSDRIEHNSDQEEILKTELLRAEKEKENLLQQKAEWQRKYEELGIAQKQIEDQLRDAMTRSKNEEQVSREKLRNELEELKREKAETLEKLSRLEEELRAALERAQTAEQALRMQKKMNEEREELKRGEAEYLEKFLRLEAQLEDSQANREKTLEELREALKRAETAERDLRIQEKGQNPACWYARIKSDSGKIREKPLYLLNVAVFDNTMVLHRPSVPDGSASDDGGGPYAVEARRLPLDDIPFGKPLTDDAVVRYLKPIQELGKSAKIRTYPCVFYVRVWDETNKGAKDRWKQAHDRVLEGLFGTYTVQDNPWPGR